MEMTNIATHRGIVTKTGKGFVAVQIESVSACASCQAHSKCGFAESKNKTVDVPTPDWQQYTVGETVDVQIDEQHGLLAVWIAYLLPAILMLAVIISLSMAHLPEYVVILAALACLGLYVGVLYLMRHRIGSRFTLTVSKC